jgi:hypothetical protein
MTKTYADECLERADRVIMTQSMIEAIISAKDVPELARRLKKACEIGEKLAMALEQRGFATAPLLIELRELEAPSSSHREINDTCIEALSQ